MNLVDLIDDKGLQQDKWSLTALTFGKEGQLTVVGWSGKRKGRSDKVYVLKCEKCSKDAELFGEGYFRSLKEHIISGRLPCGCSKRPNWSQGQFEVLCSRRAKEIGCTFVGFESLYPKAKTKIKVFCEKHGVWSTGTVDTLLNAGRGCPSCNGGVLKPDKDMIASFLATGAFHPDTKFWRSERSTGQSRQTYWNMDCPDCGEIGEAVSNNLQQGQRSCACSKQRQKECYINLVSDGDLVIALKFGIARDSSQRIKAQDKRSVYKIEQHSVYIFPDVFSCKQAERTCKQELDCGVISKDEMSDGYSETTCVHNFYRIKQIYTQHGGIEVCHSP